MKIYRHGLAVLLFSSIAALGAPVLEVKDVKGRALEIELIGLEGKNVVFQRKGDPKEFRLPLDQFDTESQTRISNVSAELPTVYPKVDAEVIIGKKREKGNSYYMVKQIINCEVKLKNPSHDLKLPPVTAKVLFIGQNQKDPESYTVLSVQSFPVELPGGGSMANELKPFSTSYDSDNKGTGNIGGYQYSGYLLFFVNDSDEVVFSQTTDANIRSAIAANPTILKEISTYKDGAYVDGKLTLQDQRLKPEELRYK